MNTFSVEDRTRTYQSRQNGYSTITKPRIRIRVKGRYTNPLVPLFDDQFERELPPETRAELEVSPQSINRPSVRIPETEEEIQQAIAWLKSQGYLRSPDPAPSPVPSPTLVSPPLPPVMPPVARPAQSAPRSGSGGWWLLAVIVGFLILVGHLPKRLQPATIMSPQPWVEVRRALPVAPRALPVTAQVSSVPTGWWQSIRMPDGSFIGVRYQGELASSAALPPQGHFIGEEYSVGTTSWIWMTRPGASLPSWVDP